MSKHVFLQRHTEATDANGIKDFDRPLSTFGKKQAQHIASLLNHNSIKTQKILCSPSIRTKQTLEIISTALNCTVDIEFKDSLYSASTEDLNNIIKAQDDFINSMMIIGHNPTITSINMEFSLDHSSKLFRKSCDYTIPGKLTIVKIKTLSWQHVFNEQAYILQVVFPLME
ncbi:MAG: SixA phosphatase family protein [Alphaproteobacteria bacterium]|jgi:phosphohistidine phosphatase|nr:histidine phosphatase family protein [Candidatus Jidaibacter sp.]